MNAAIILAAGNGSRFGAEIPKQYVEVLGKPVLAYTLEAFEASPDIHAIAVVCRPEFYDRVSEIAKKYNIGKLRWIVPGGDSCPMSIKSGIYALRGILSEKDNIVLHTGVGPLVGQSDIASALKVCSARGCCFTMHPVNICMARRGGDGWAQEDAPKEQYIELNTPWTFRYGDLLGLYEQLESSGYVIGDSDYTLGLWLNSGRRAYYTPGSAPGRLKITTVHDMDLFEGILMLRHKRRNEQGGKYE